MTLFTVYKNMSQEPRIPQGLDKEQRTEWKSLFEITQMLSASSDLRAILNYALLTPMERLMIGKGIFLLHKGEDCYAVELSKGLPDEVLGQRLTITSLPERHFLATEIDRGTHTWIDWFHDSDIHLLLPVNFRNHPVGLLGFGQRASCELYSEDEIAFITSLASLCATSIANIVVSEELRQVNLRLDRKVQELNTLFDIGKGLNSTLDAKQIVRMLGYALMGQMFIQRYLIIVERDGHGKLLETKGCGSLESVLNEYPSLLPWLRQIAKPYRLDQDLGDDVNRWLKAAGLAVVVPMLSQERTRGVIALGPRLSGKPYLDDDLEFLYVLGNQALISLENAWYFEEALEMRRLEEELSLAREIQQKLFPKSMPEVSGYEIAATNLPTKQVGGDYYDVIRIDDRHFSITIADVSGKGMPAALLMSNLQASLHALIPEIPSSVSLVAKINNLIYHNTDPSKYITFFYGVLDVAKATFTYINAGHNPPFLVRADRGWQRLDKGGVPLGLLPNAVYEAETVTLHPGDLMVLYTDGITEASNRQDEEFGELRLQATIEDRRSVSPGEVLEEIAARVADFSRGLPQADDITLMVLRAGV